MAPSLSCITIVVKPVFGHDEYCVVFHGCERPTWPMGFSHLLVGRYPPLGGSLLPSLTLIGRSL